MMKIQTTAEILKYYTEGYDLPDNMRQEIMGLGWIQVEDISNFIKECLSNKNGKELDDLVDWVEKQEVRKR